MKSIHTRTFAVVAALLVTTIARAEEKVYWDVFEDIKDNIQVIYTTHSPHLVDIDKLHRVLAIQRDDVENQRSATTKMRDEGGNRKPRAPAHGNRTTRTCVRLPDTPFHGTARRNPR